MVQFDFRISFALAHTMGGNSYQYLFFSAAELHQHALWWAASSPVGSLDCAWCDDPTRIVFYTRNIPREHTTSQSVKHLGHKEGCYGCNSHHSAAGAVVNSKIRRKSLLRSISVLNGGKVTCRGSKFLQVLTIICIPLDPDHTVDEPSRHF
jgi:hypothetical protein